MFSCLYIICERISGLFPGPQSCGTALFFVDLPPFSMVLYPAGHKN